MPNFASFYTAPKITKPMTTLNIIIEEIKNVPIDKLEELYQFVHSLTVSTQIDAENKRQAILSFGGAFSNMSDDDYADYVKYIQKTRNELFDRNITL
jgi:hypothetical protein